MKPIEVIEKLWHDAVVWGLDGMDFLSGFADDVVAREYNGIGPEYLPADLRDKITSWLGVFEPAALIHDLRNYNSDGMAKAFHYANDEFLANCLKCAAAKYAWWNLKRYRAYAVAKLLYRFVDGPFGWKAWMDCYNRKQQDKKEIKK